MSASKRNITHCKYGHEFTPENTRINKGGKRSCKICEFYKHLKKQYGISPQEYQQVIDTQGGKCPRCGIILSDPNVVFDRETKKVESIRCYACSRIRGEFKIPTHCSKGHELTEDNLFVYPEKRTWFCRECGRANGQRWKKDNPDKVRLSNSTPEARASQKRKRMKRNAKFPRYYKGRDLKKFYKMTLEDWDRMYSEQKGLCDICKTEVENPVVDHNHLTGKVRGLLCRTCNLGIGHLQESPEVLLSAIEYLQKHKES